MTKMMCNTFAILARNYHINKMNYQHTTYTLLVHSVGAGPGMMNQRMIEHEAAGPGMFSPTRTLLLAPSHSPLSVLLFMTFGCSFLF